MTYQSAVSQINEARKHLRNGHTKRAAESLRVVAEALPHVEGNEHELRLLKRAVERLREGK